MPYSMTGFSRVEFDCSGVYSLELRSVNHRFLEISCSGFSASMEMEFKKYLESHLQRGKINLSLKAPSHLQTLLVPNWDFIDTCVKTSKEIAAKTGLSGSLELRDLFSFPNVFIQESPDEAMLHLALREHRKVLVDEFLQSRFREGEALSLAMFTYLEEIERRVREIAVLRQNLQPAYFTRLKERLSSLVQEGLDEMRLHTEAAILVEKSDVEEELVRLLSHIGLCKKLLQDASPGRQLGFVVQEMQREINTTGSKSQDLTVVGKVLEMKVFLEKIREQIQNLE